jgi:hypothetical protein
MTADEAFIVPVAIDDVSHPSSSQVFREDQFSPIDHELQAFADFRGTALGQQSVVSSRKFAS